jgi:hypothetical protein
MSTDPIPNEIPDSLRPLAAVGEVLEGVYRKLIGLRRYLSEEPEAELVPSLSLTYRLAVQMAVPEVAAAAPWMDDPARPPGERWTSQVAGELLELSRFYVLLEKGDLPIGELARDYTTDTPWGWNYLHLAQHLAQRIDEVAATLAVAAAPAAAPVEPMSPEQSMERFALAVGDETAGRILAIAQKMDLSVERRMEEILRIDRRFAEKDSNQWATLLQVTPPAIRGCRTWKLLRQRKAED